MPNTALNGDTPFCDWIRVLVARICERDGLTRQQLAERLGVHLHSISSAAYRGAVGCELAIRIAAIAAATPEERRLLEVAWLRAKAEIRRDDAFQRALRILNENGAEIRALKQWISDHGYAAAYDSWRNASEPAASTTAARAPRPHLRASQ